MPTKTTTVELAAEMTIAWLSNPNNRSTVNEVPVILRSMHDAVAKLSAATDGDGPKAPKPEYTPAVSIRKSLVNPDYIISLIDGKPYKALRRHLTMNGLTPDEYRERYDLKSDYPIVSEGYSEVRRAMAKKIGLGRKPGQRPTTQAEATSETLPAQPRRKTKTIASVKAE
ncbi:MucR family transcriptional regulator [Sphingomonas sp. PAMC 26621]|uniref:MucR family transcriptional regulator n=1 Tax=Sphingomonas sp. PAMC 26621 TaxID=1112213 RepID=UPI0002889193|nr:MucR family transcriptional regulator [Sphingomonas sp. PAMC 26621]